MASGLLIFRHARSLPASRVSMVCVGSKFHHCGLPLCIHQLQGRFHHPTCDTLGRIDPGHDPRDVVRSALSFARCWNAPSQRLLRNSTFLVVYDFVHHLASARLNGEDRGRSRQDVGRCGSIDEGPLQRSTNDIAFRRCDETTTCDSTMLGGGRERPLEELGTSCQFSGCEFKSSTARSFHHRGPDASESPIGGSGRMHMDLTLLHSFTCVSCSHDHSSTAFAQAQVASQKQTSI